jgi:glycosyltransferase A (GT-A) superfamily protein (DUF2064 family)
MVHILITLAHDPTVRPMFNQLTEHFGQGAADLYDAFLFDSMALAGRVSGVRTTVVAQAPSVLTDHISSATGLAVVSLSDRRFGSIAGTVARALDDGPVVLLGGDLPHLPIWRLRDTFTYMENGADVVIGPGENGGWYLLGMRAAHPALLRAIPARDESPDNLCIAAATHDLRVAQLPPWYTLNTIADLERLSADLRTMPPDTAPYTRTLLSADGVRARAVGG